MHWFNVTKRWLYRGDRPNWLARILNHFWAWVHASGIAPNYLATLDVKGRKSGKMIAVPVVLAISNGQRYLVSMLGNEAQWELNIQADGNRAVLRAGKSQPILLKPVAVEQRAPIVKAYLQRAPGARPHISVHKDAPLSEFEKVAERYPVFRIVPQ